MSDQKVILITGASSGVGRAAAERLAQDGHRVFGTSRNPSGIKIVPGLSMLELDVRSDASAKTCLKAILDQADRIDVLVNNAAYELSGAIEETSIEEARAQFETNFFGVMRMVKHILPSMRQQRSGQIINVSSLAGFVPVPFMGIYSASKFAVEGFTEALRYEIGQFNIKVSQIEVSFLNTPMMQHRQVVSRRIEGYDLLRQRAFDAIRESEMQGSGPELVAKAIQYIIASKKPRLRYVVGQEARMVSALKILFPEWMFEKAVQNAFSLGTKE